MIPLVDLGKQYQSIKEEIDEAIRQVIVKNDFILGSEVESFENSFAHYIGTKHAIGVSSGFAAIKLGLVALGLKKGDEVITAANTFVATILGAMQLGAKIKLVDVDPDTYNIDVRKLKKALTPKTKFIIPVHLYGLPADMGEIMTLSKEYGLVVLEDAAQAHGAAIRQQKVGTFGNIGAFSFYPSKNLGAFGDAGMVVTSDDQIAKQVRILRNVGQGSKYHHILQGYNARLDTIQAAVLQVKLRYLENWNSRRGQIVQWYNEYLSNSKIKLPSAPAGYHSAWHLYVIQVKGRQKIVNHLQTKGIYSSIHYPIPIHIQAAFKKLGYQRGDFPVTEKLSEKILSLPLFPELTKKEVEFICRTTLEAI